ncbi:MAG: RagB/SusD family nutrient uptake outer membrane protein [Prevotella sp.]|nr:RagB/SusD family nutrient uptake outer membrane protein [Prevotella sp.]
MKLYKISTLMLGAALLTVSCSEIDEQNPESGSLTTEQVQETNLAISSRLQATFDGMFNIMAKPYAAYPSSSRADDFGFVMAAISLDYEGADMTSDNNGYNWFGTPQEYSTRNANYANPFIRYKIPYTLIGLANDFIAAVPNPEEASGKNQIAQARALRCFAYMALAPYFQFGYGTAADQPCVPLLTDGVDFTNNPRATVKEVYEYIINELNAVIADLGGLGRSSKAYVDENVAYGLRARANLAMGKYAEAAADAEKAAQGYTPASIAEVSVPAFCKLSEHNWIWGINVFDDLVKSAGYPTSSSWMSAFTGDGYGPACTVVPCINVLLYDKIPETDVRKGWWLDANRHSPNWAGLTWVDPADASISATGDEIADFSTSDGGKIPFPAYTNIKFGQKSGVGNSLNNNDWPLMRVEEMILIQAEGYAKSGNESKGRQILESFVKTYRDPSYSSEAGGRTLADEIWYQRRVELWGEGFFVSDAKRLGKPIVRIHSASEDNGSNLSPAFQFNIDASNAYLNMRFPQTEMNNNRGIVDNQGGSQPVAGDNPTLRDGVTD